MAATCKGSSTPATEILRPRYSSSWTPHTHFSACITSPLLKSLQDLPHVDHVLLVISAADDNIILPGKGGLAVSNSSVYVPLEGWPSVPQT